MSFSLRRSKRCPLPSERAPRAQLGAQSPSDSTLLATMATRLATVEKELEGARKELAVQEDTIASLHARLSVFEGGGGGDQLQRRCLALQQQVDDMEEFLSDYGLVWVGASGGWRPSESTAPVDFDLIVRNVQELNALLVEEGGAEVCATALGAELKEHRCPSVPLMLYSNGLLLFDGPFRPYSDPATCRCVHDLMDGYFPAELQARYPGGMVLALTDRRNVSFRQRQSGDAFPGAGKSVGGAKGPSRLTSDLPGPHVPMETSDLPGPRVSMETFLSRLPCSVVRGGRVVDVRADVARMLVGDEGVKVVETPVLQEIKSRLDVSEELRPPTPCRLTTLRVRSQNGQQMFVLKMKHSDTIGQVRQQLDTLRASGEGGYELRCVFPSRRLTDPGLSLLQCGLSPSANLFMAPSTTHTHTA